jgi:RNA polymerase sigma-70 factor, ECF subfamily
MRSSDELAGDSRPGTSITLLDRARANEAGAWDRLVSLYAPLVVYWCRAAGLPPDDSDDLLQEVFLAAATGLARFRHDQPGYTFRGWLRGITRNTLLAHYRRRTREPAGEGGTESQRRIQGLAEPDVHLPEDDPPEQSRAVYRRALELVRGEFEEKTWQMFWQVAVEDQPVADVAERFGVTAAAVRKAKSRVLFRLKQEVGDIIE